MTSAPLRSASLYVATTILLLGAGLPRPALGQADAERAKQASRAFAEGSKLFDQADYVGAIEAFTKAHALRPHFSVLCNIALSHERLGDMIRAGGVYKRCYAEGAEKTENAEAVRNSIQRVEGRVGWFQVSAPSPGGEVYLDGKPLGPAPRRVPLNPGQHVIEVRRPGAEPAREALIVRGGEQRSLELSPTTIAESRPVERPKPGQGRRRLRPVWFFSTAGLAVALGVVATVLGVQTLGIKSDYEASPTRELYDRGRTRRLLTNLFWAGAAASAGSSAVLFFYTDFSRLGRGRAERPEVVSFGLQGTF
jgi:hypothetical protein